MRNKIILFLVAFAVLGVSLFVVPKANATYVDECLEEFEYTKDEDFDDSRVNINFFNFNPAGPNNDEYRVTVTAKAGYELVSIWYDYDGDGEGNLDDEWVIDENPETVDAPGIHDVSDVKVVVRKTCALVCSDELANNYEEPVAGQTTGGGECDYDTALWCIDGVTTEVAVNEDPKGEVVTEGACVVEPEVPGEPPVVHSAPSSTEAPSCPNSEIKALADNFHIERRGAEADYRWFWPKFELANNANLYFREMGSTVWEHAHGNVARTQEFQEVTVFFLKPFADYQFALEITNGCGKGVIQVVDDSWQPQIFGNAYVSVL